MSEEKKEPETNFMDAFWDYVRNVGLQFDGINGTLKTYNTRFNALEKDNLCTDKESRFMATVAILIAIAAVFIAVIALGFTLKNYRQNEDQKATILSNEESTAQPTAASTATTAHAFAARAILFASRASFPACSLDSRIAEVCALMSSGNFFRTSAGCSPSKTGTGIVGKFMCVPRLMSCTTFRIWTMRSACFSRSTDCVKASRSSSEACSHFFMNASPALSM